MGIYRAGSEGFSLFLLFLSTKPREERVFQLVILYRHYWYLWIFPTIFLNMLRRFTATSTENSSTARINICTSVIGHSLFFQNGWTPDFRWKGSYRNEIEVRRWSPGHCLKGGWFDLSLRRVNNVAVENVLGEARVFAPCQKSQLYCQGGWRSSNLSEIQVNGLALSFWGIRKSRAVPTDWSAVQGCLHEWLQ